MKTRHFEICAERYSQNAVMQLRFWEGVFQINRRGNNILVIPDQIEFSQSLSAEQPASHQMLRPARTAAMTGRNAAY